jgi:hypothetical protein
MVNDRWKISVFSIGHFSLNRESLKSINAIALAPWSEYTAQFGFKFTIAEQGKICIKS